MSLKNGMKVLLVGNASYENRGCEAIVRGTAEILRHYLGEDVKFINASFGRADVLDDQAQHEVDPNIDNRRLFVESPRFSRDWFGHQLNRRLGTNIGLRHSTIEDAIRECDFALEIGGDNYSLDYGIPWSYVELDWFIQKSQLPLALWGASVGPFDDNPEFASRMLKHLRSLDAVLVRETASLEYLARNGVYSNVHLVADPSFAMKPIVPSADELGFSIPTSFIGLNVSPLIARYATNGNLDAWEEFCVEMVDGLLSRFDDDLVLIPHVFSDFRKGDDGKLCDNIYNRLNKEQQARCHTIGRQLNAETTKGLISRSRLFAGARTHSTFASLSCAVPTISFAYSLKAVGINADMMGGLDFCIQPKELSLEKVLERFVILDRESDNVRNHLIRIGPTYKERAYHAGEIVRDLVKGIQFDAKQFGNGQRPVEAAVICNDVGYNTGYDSFAKTTAWALDRYFCVKKCRVLGRRIRSGESVGHFRLIGPVDKFSQANKALFPKVLGSSRPNYIVIGGGANLTSSNIIRDYLEFIRASRPSIAFAAGTSVGPFEDEEARSLCAELIRELEFIGLRDEASARRVIELVPNCNYRLTFDLMPMYPVAARLTNDFPDDCRCMVGVSLCGFSEYAEFSDEATTALVDVVGGAIERAYADGRLDEILLVVMSRKPVAADHRIHKMLAESLSGRVPVRMIPYRDDPSEIFNWIGRLKGIIAMRLAASVFAYTSHTPSIMIAYHEKCWEWAKTIGMAPESILDCNDLDVEKLSQALGRMLDGAFLAPCLEVEEAQRRSELNWTWRFS